MSEGGLEPPHAGNFPNSGKFPWAEHSGRCPRAPGISRSVPLPGPGGGPKSGRGRSRGLRSAGIPRLTAGRVRPGRAGHQPLPATACRGRAQPRRSRFALPAEPGQAKYPPFGTPMTTIVRLAADIQNRLFWRVSTGRASESQGPRQLCRVSTYFSIGQQHILFSAAFSHEPSKNREYVFHMQPGFRRSALNLNRPRHLSIAVNKVEVHDVRAAYLERVGISLHAGCRGGWAGGWCKGSGPSEDVVVSDGHGRDSGGCIWDRRNNGRAGGGSRWRWMRRWCRWRR